MAVKSFEFEKIADNFEFAGRFLRALPYGCGHINDTFAVYFEKSDGGEHRYILQRINHKVFKNPIGLMNNIAGVTTFLRRKIIKAGGNPERETLNLIPAKDGRVYYQDEECNYWRGYLFIEKAQTYQVVENPMHFYKAGRAFGRFQKLLCDYPAATLTETIPGFHNTVNRFCAFREAVSNDIISQVANVKEEIEFALRREEDAAVLLDLLADGMFPLKVTHNDTKFNNVMIDDKTGEGICVIDLDTVMPGLALYDFGDSMRSGTNTALEDEKDLSKVWMDIGLFESYSKGFLEEVGEALTPTEIEYLPFAVKIMTFECGIRFLADHLNGDTYFKIHREGHNLDRARTQFKLVADMEEKMGEMKTIIKKYCK